MNFVTPRILPVILALLLLQSLPARAQSPSTQPAESKAARDARMAWWRAARFGMFIHWGVYSAPAGTYNGKKIPSLGEWIMNNAKIPVAEYAKYCDQFTPVEIQRRPMGLLAQTPA
jgi:alpha-L-fucosidase